MKRFNRYTVTIMVNLLAFAVSAQKDSEFTDPIKRNPIENRNHTVSNQIQIITAEQIRKSGYTRVSDVLQMADAYSFATATGTSWMLQSNGVGSMLNQRVILMVDGQRMDVQSPDGTLDVNALAISVADIKRIEIVNAAGNYLGEFNDRGIIHIITKEQLSDGWVYNGFVAHGVSEFLPSQAVPVSLAGGSNFLTNAHTGLVHSHRLMYKKNKWSFSAQYTSQNNPTLSGIEQQSIDFWNQTNPNASNNLINGSVDAGRISIAYQSQQVFSQTDMNFSVSNRLLFYALDARYSEQIQGIQMMPYRAYRRYQLQNAYTAGATNYTRIKTQKGYLQLRNAFWMNGTDLNTNDLGASGLAAKGINSNLSYVRQGNGSKNTIQYGVASFVYIIPSNIFYSDYTFFVSPYISATKQLNKKTFLSGDLYAGTDGKAFLPKASITYYKAPTILNNYSLVAAYSRHSIFEDTYLSAYMHNATRYSNEPVQQNASLDGYYNLNIGKHFKVSLNSGLKLANNEAIYSYQNILMPPISTFPWHILFSNTDFQLRSLRWVNRFNIHYDVLRNVMLDFNYLNIRMLNSNHPDIGMPRNRFTTQFTIDLSKNTSVWIRHLYQSAIRWVDFRDISNATDFLSNPYVEVGNMHVFHVALNQQLWKKRANISINYRNAISNGVWGREQYLPVDNHMNFRIFASLQLYLHPQVGKPAAKP